MIRLNWFNFLLKFWLIFVCSFVFFLKQRYLLLSQQLNLFYQQVHLLVNNELPVYYIELFKFILEGFLKIEYLSFRVLFLSSFISKKHNLYSTLRSVQYDHFQMQLNNLTILRFDLYCIKILKSEIWSYILKMYKEIKNSNKITSLICHINTKTF